MKAFLKRNASTILTGLGHGQETHSEIVNAFSIEKSIQHGYT